MAKNAGKYAGYSHLNTKDRVINAPRILPLYELMTFEDAHKKHYSLSTNEQLIGRWEAFKRTMEGRERVPYQFPHYDYFHYFNNAVRYIPAQTWRIKALEPNIFDKKVDLTHPLAPIESFSRKTEKNLPRPRELPPRKLYKRLYLKKAELKY